MHRRIVLSFTAPLPLLAAACQPDSTGLGDGDSYGSTETDVEGSAGTEQADGDGDPGTGDGDGDGDGDPSTGDGDGDGDPSTGDGDGDGDPGDGDGDGDPGDGDGDGDGMLATEENLKVAFIGDQGLGPNPIAVLDMVEAEGAAFVIHVGDFDYANLPPLWDAQINLALADDFPYFAALGNHDVDVWPLYRNYLETRLAKINGAECVGELGAKSSCHYKGLHFLLSGVGTYAADHEEWIIDELIADESIWSICAWHKNQNDMQAGGKGDEVGWEAYKACQDNAAIIITGHEHSYSRTMTLSDLGNVASGHGAAGAPDLMTVSEGSTFVAVSGLGGVNSRDYIAAQHDDDTWWATIWTNNYYLNNGVVVPDHEVDFGALFIDFYVDGDPYKARGYFKTSGGQIIDEFDIVRE